MKRMLCLGYLLLLSATFAAGDSIALRSGRHLQGRYLGGTATTVGFMTGSAIEYFSTADVIAVLFDGAAEPGTGTEQPRPMKHRQPEGRSRTTPIRRTRMAGGKETPAVAPLL
jgi:hypothetical protein